MMALLKLYGGNVGQVASLTQSVLSPAEFARSCRAIVENKSGDEAHHALDLLVTELLSSLGYGEGMAVFLDAVKPYHATTTRPATMRGG